MWPFKSKKPTVYLDEVLKEYDVIGLADGQVPIVTPKNVDTRELGSSSPSPFTGSIMQEYNHELVGTSGIAKYKKMRMSDTTVSGTLRAVKLPIIQARWFISPADESPEAKKIADFVWYVLNERMSITWTQVVVEALFSLDYGYYIFEKVWDIENVNPITGKRQIVLRKLAPRHPADVIDIEYDKHGGPESVEMVAAKSKYELGNVKIPIKKLIILTNDREANNVRGMSILRPAYRNWYYKDIFLKIDAIQKERHGIGIPIIKLPPNPSLSDKEKAENLGKNLRTNERAHIILPFGWEIVFAEIRSNPVNAMESVQYHDSQMREHVLTAFIGDKKSTSEEDVDLLHKAARLFADNICDTFNKYLINELVDYNFSTNLYPKLNVKRVGEQNAWRVLSFTLRNLIGSGVVRPDDQLEKWIRSEFDLPEADIETVRVVATPQASPATAPTVPNQSVNGKPNPQGAAQVNQTGQNKGSFGLPNQRPQVSVTAPQKNAGTDRSGG